MFKRTVLELIAEELLEDQAGQEESVVPIGRYAKSRALANRLATAPVSPAPHFVCASQLRPKQIPSRTPSQLLNTASPSAPACSGARPIITSAQASPLEFLYQQVMSLLSFGGAAQHSTA